MQILESYLMHPRAKQKSSICSCFTISIWIRLQETNTSGAIWFMQDTMFTSEHGDRPRAPNLGIVITDGASNRDAELLAPYAYRAHRASIRLIAVGNEYFLNKDKYTFISLRNTIYFMWWSMYFYPQTSPISQIEYKYFTYMPIVQWNGYKPRHFILIWNGKTHHSQANRVQV